MLCLLFSNFSFPAESIKRTKKLAKKVPEGTSEYQAAWILDSDEEWEDVESEEEDEAMEEELEPREDEVSQVCETFSHV